MVAFFTAFVIMSIQPKFSVLLDANPKYPPIPSVINSAITSLITSIIKSLIVLKLYLKPIVSKSHEVKNKGYDMELKFDHYCVLLTTLSIFLEASFPI